MKPVNAAIIYYSATGTVHALAKPPPRARSQPRRPGLGPAALFGAPSTSAM